MSLVLGKHTRSPPRSVVSDREPADPRDEDVNEAFEARDDDDVDSASSDDDEIHTLPASAPRAFRRVFSLFAKGEAGHAELYMHACVNSVCTVSLDAKTDIVWMRAENDMWVQKETRQWRSDVYRDLNEALVRVAKYIKKELRMHRAVDPTGKGIAVKTWSAALRKMEGANSIISSDRGINAVCRLIFDRLRDDRFMGALNATRSDISFQNGILDLKTLVLRPRTREDYCSYALPYDYDPEASTEAIREYVHSLYEDSEAETALQTLVGYWMTGQTTEKAFWQISAPPNSGKTTLMNALLSTAGEYFSKGVPISEMSTGSEFEDGFARVLRGALPPRAILFDEIKSNVTLKEDMINQLTDGKEQQGARFRKKGVDSVSVLHKYHSKLIFISNHALLFPLGADGTSMRSHGIGLRFQFQNADEFSRANVHHRPQNPALCAFLESPAARPGIMRWIAEGSKAFYDGEKLTCPLFDASTFSLQVRGNPYLEWLSKKYFPTGEIFNTAHRVITDVLVKEYIADKTSPLTNATAHRGLVALLNSMSDYVSAKPWEQYGLEVIGYTGLRLRKPLDPEWQEAREAARLKAASYV